MYTIRGIQTNIFVLQALQNENICPVCIYFSTFALRNNALRSSCVIPLASFRGLVSVDRIVKGVVFKEVQVKGDSRGVSRATVSTLNKTA